MSEVVPEQAPEGSDNAPVDETCVPECAESEDVSKEEKKEDENS